MDADRIPADVLGLIFSQLDLKGMVSLALTCRRFLSLFNLYSSSTLFTDNWTFEHPHNLQLSPNESTGQIVKCIITYIGLPPEFFRHEFDATNRIIKWSPWGSFRSPQDAPASAGPSFAGPSFAGPNNIFLALPRLYYVIEFTKRFSRLPIIPMSGYIDYHVIGVNALKQPHRYHVFRLICQGQEKTYIQYHRNVQKMIVASFNTHIMTSCNFFDHLGHNMLAISLEQNTASPHYCLQYSGKDGIIKQWTYSFTDDPTMLDVLSCQYPAELARVFLLSYISNMSRVDETNKDVISLDLIVHQYLSPSAIIHLYLR